MGTLLSVLLALTAPHAFAAQVPVSLLNDTTNIEETVNAAKSHAHADIKGKGPDMVLTYTSEAPLQMFIVFLKDNGAFEPLDSLKTTLPAGEHMNAEIDVSVSPAWSPIKKRYRLYFFSDSPAGATFHDIAFTRVTASSVLGTFVRHALQTPPYTPLSYHRIAPYKIMNISVSAVCGILLLIALGILTVKRRFKQALAVSVVIVLIANARFSIDAVRYSVTHMADWYGSSVYASAGSLPLIGKDLLARNAHTVHLCNDGTTYASEIFQYHAYPVLLTSELSEYVVVHRSADWSYEGDTLRCKAATYRAAKVTEYPDGSLLFSVTP